MQLPSIPTVVWNQKKHDFSLISWGILGMNEGGQWSLTWVGEAVTVALDKGKDQV